MIRLTIKNQSEDGFVEYLSHEDRNANYICIQKLGRYEDNDEDLGINYSLLSEVLKKGLYQIVSTDLHGNPVDIKYIKNVFLDLPRKSFIEVIITRDVCLEQEIINYKMGTAVIRIEDFKKRKLSGWALTKEELI